MGDKRLIEGCIASLRALKERGARVHCITNLAAVTLSANALLALGATPSTTVDPEEVADFTRSADALSVNIGTLDAERRRAIPLAVEVAQEEGKPWVFDPVMATRAQSRRALADALLAKNPTVIRGNQAEIAALDIPQETVRAATGAVDRIAQGARAVQIENGDPLMDRVTAMGCAETAVIAAFLTVEHDPFLATAQAVLAFAVAGETAAEAAEGPGTFQPLFLDALHNLSALSRESLSEKARTAWL
ncbi:MAG: hydroxyethylthiazole kinase [Alphaproteobacteria bacterium]|nr:hydroxyethylthiazole kinase [Alphaproteobacteria bacterium]